MYILHTVIQFKFKESEETDIVTYFYNKGGYDIATDLLDDLKYTERIDEDALYYVQTILKNYDDLSALEEKLKLKENIKKDTYEKYEHMKYIEYVFDNIFLKEENFKKVAPYFIKPTFFKNFDILMYTLKSNGIKLTKIRNKFLGPIYDNFNKDTILKKTFGKKIKYEVLNFKGQKLYRIEGSDELLDKKPEYTDEELKKQQKESRIYQLALRARNIDGYVKKDRTIIKGIYERLNEYNTKDYTFSDLLDGKLEKRTNYIKTNYEKFTQDNDMNKLLKTLIGSEWEEDYKDKLNVEKNKLKDKEEFETVINPLEHFIYLFEEYSEPILRFFYETKAVVWVNTFIFIKTISLNL